MKVFTNENNVGSLKVLISAEFAQANVDIEIVKVEDSRFQHPRRLPVIEFDKKTRLFSSNAACLAVLPAAQKHTKAVQEWLLWEASQLEPLLVQSVSKLDADPRIEKLLTHLDSSLQKKQYLVGDSVTVADICIWAILYPILTDERLKTKLLSTNTSLCSWMESLLNCAQFSKAVTKLDCKGLPGLQSLSSASWYPALSTVASSPTEVNKEPVLTESDIKAAVDAWNAGPALRPKPKPRTKPILPVKGEKNVLITSALPYVNNVPHLGNIIGCVLSADVYSRYCRLRNWNTLYISGTDEYGTATETKALEEGLSPKEICDKYFAIHKDIYNWFNIDFDLFGRTTDQNQTEIVQDLFKACHQNGYTSTATVEQLLCQKCDRFLADRFVEGICPRCKYEDARGDQCDGCGHLINAVELIQPRCKVCQSTPVIRQSQQLFLELPKLESQLNSWMNKTSDEWSHNAMVITKAWLKDGLKPRCITRDLKWGIPVPLEGFESKVFYVWFDAPIGYISMTKTYTDKWLSWWKPDPSTQITFYQFMAKDNVPFHAIMFPATLMASQGNYTIVNHLMATEYLNYEDGKFSKSRGVGVFGNDAKETGISSDVFRFYLLYVRPESQDSSFSWADMAMKNNSELLNNLGNFINRALTFTEKFFNSTIPPIQLTDEENHLLGLISLELKAYMGALDRAKLRDGIRFILNISRHGNQYIQSNQPWVKVKGSAEDKERAGTVIGFANQMAALLAILLQPYMPQTSQTIKEQLNLSPDCFVLTESFVPLLQTGHRIGKPSPLFSKIEQSTIDQLKQKYAGRQKSESPPKQVATNGPQTLEEVTAAVAKQADLVRTLKTSGQPKDVWQPEVAILLDLKKKLASLEVNGNAQKSDGSRGEPQNPPPSSNASGKKKKKK